MISAGRGLQRTMLRALDLNEAEGHASHLAVELWKQLTRQKTRPDTCATRLADTLAVEHFNDEIRIQK